MTRVPPAQYEPDIAIPPGRTIQEVLDALCMSQEDLANRMERRPSHINDLILGRRPITVDTAISLERVLGSPANFWLNLEKNYRLTLARLREAASREQDAVEVRRAWMSMMGFSSEEREEHCRHCPPTDLDEELSQYNAMFAIQAMNG